MENVHEDSNQSVITVAAGADASLVTATPITSTTPVSMTRPQYRNINQNNTTEVFLTL